MLKKLTLCECVIKGRRRSRAISEMVRGLGEEAQGSRVLSTPVEDPAVM